MVFFKKVINLFSGSGGNGSLCKKYKNKLPFFSGGDGGDGGNIYIFFDSYINSINFYKNKYFSENGFSGKCNNNYGKNGKNLILRIPLRCKYKIKNEKFKKFFKNKLIILINGGKGGRGINNKNYNNKFIIKGNLGYNKVLILNYIISFDIIFIGFTNSGKTTFLNNLLNLNFKFSNYNYTTLKYNIIKFNIFKKNKFLILDLRGLIKIRNNHYVNYNFLNYIKNSKINLIFIDISLINYNFLYIIKNFKNINYNLYILNKILFYKNKIFFLNKIDLIKIKFFKNIFKKYFFNIKFYNFSFYISSYIKECKYILNFLIKYF